MAIDVDGSTQYVDLGGVDMPASSEAMSLFCWCMVDTIDDLRIVAKANGSASVQDAWWLTGFDSAGHKSRLKTGGTAHTLSVGPTYATGVWIHTGFTYHSAGAGGDGWIAYKDGVSVVTDAGKTGVIDTDPAVDLWIGGNPPALDRQFDGLIADVRVYERALSAEEMQTVFALRGADGIVEGLLHRWPLSELGLGAAASGAGTIRDVAQTAVHGTPVSSPVYAGSPLGARGAV